MARNKRHATKMGIMGAALGAINFKLSENAQRLAEEAEARKEARLEQILMAREGRQEQRDIAGDERRFAQQDKTLQSQQDHDAARAGQDFEYQSQLQRDRIAAQQAEGAADRSSREGIASADRANALEIANLRTTEANPVIVLGSDGKTYDLRTQELPAGVEPVGGSGMSWAPSKSKQGVLPTRPGAAVPTNANRFQGFSIHTDASE